MFRIDGKSSFRIANELLSPSLMTVVTFTFRVRSLFEMHWTPNDSYDVADPA